MQDTMLWIMVGCNADARTKYAYLVDALYGWTLEDALREYDDGKPWE